jgi:heme-degrading monooxygenase HmoA
MSVVEVTTFALAKGANEEAFLVLDRRVQTELIPNQPGFMRRTTARRGDRWAVLTLWGSEEQAAAFEAVNYNHPIQVEFDGHLETGSVETHRYDTLD